MRTYNSVPEIMKVTAELNNETITHAEPKAGMFLLFLISGLTMLGALAGTASSVYLVHHERGASWLTGVLLCSFIGSVLGCALGMLMLGFKGLVRWEHRKHLQERADER